MPTPAKDRDTRFWDKSAEKYAAQKVADEETYRIKLERTGALFTPEMTVLEFGCGTGTTALHHAASVARIDAYDISENMIAIARKKAERAGIANVAFRVGDIEDIDGGPYDAVMAHSILHLLKNRQAVLAKVHAMLKPDGLFISSTACIADGLGFLRPILPVMRLFGKAPYVGVFSQATLVEEMREAGFSIIEEWRPGKMKAAFVIARKG